MCRVAAHRGTSGGLAEGALLMALGFSAQTTQTFKSAHKSVVDMSSNFTELTVPELGISAQTTQTFKSAHESVAEMYV